MEEHNASIILEEDDYFHERHNLDVKNSQIVRNLRYESFGGELPAIERISHSRKRRKLPSSKKPKDVDNAIYDDASTGNNAEMAPRPNGDLFIEPAGDYDVIYGDYNSTMDDGSATGKRPYLRLTSKLPNITRRVGDEVRLKCEVAGAPLPIHFAWLKNLAPLEKNPRVRVRNKDYWSKLVISNVDVLDSGYYQCTASNPAGSTNSTSVLRVNPSVSATSSKNAHSVSGNSGKLSANNGRLFQNPPNNRDSVYDDYDNNIYSDETRPSFDDMMQVPNSAGGAGFAPVSSDRWLENRVLHKGECVLYQGTSCSQFLAGKHVKITSENREDIYDIDRHLTAAMMFIKNMPNVSDACKRYSHAVACYHLFKVCDRPPLTSYESSLVASSSNDVISICKKDCDTLQTNECPNEFSIAAQHDLVGDGPKALLPKCETLSATAPRCIQVLEPSMPFFPSNSNPVSTFDTSSASSSNALCYDGDGRNYEGPVSRTKSQTQCLSWPHSTSTQFNTGVYPRLKNAKNYCRNPDGRRPEPFCYTLPLNSASGAVLVEEACDIPRCQSIDNNRGASDIYVRPPGGGVDAATAPPLLDSLTNVWRSLSPQQWQLVAVSGLSGVALLLLILLVCCLCCCCWRRGGRRSRKSSANGGIVAGGSNSGVNVESVSSMISGSNMKKNNANFVRMAGGGSSAGNSDINSAYFHKIRDERARNGCGDSDVLNPLLNPSDQFAMNPQQQQMFELQPQNYRWVGNGSVNTGDVYSGSLQYLPSHLHHSLPHHPQQQQQQFPPTYPLHQQQQLLQQQFGNGGANNLSGGSPHTSTEPPAEPYQIPTIQEHQLKFDNRRVVGEDASTILYPGEWIGGLISGASLNVIIKTVKPGANKVAIENFREEIKEVGPFEHINVVRMFGVAYLSQQNISAVFDYMIHGDLHEFLKVREPRCTNKNDEDEYLRNAEDFLRICTQIVAGMEYLASFNYVHRDLSARNCLVGDQQVIKISDFARMKPAYDNDYYRINQGMKVPLRWLSREAFNEGKYSQASDVYACGVTFWEIYTYGKQPYENFSDQQVIDMLSDELTLEAPSFCPPIIYGVIVNCTNTDPKRRPTFAELHPRFEKWCNTNQSQALLPGGRASSVHSGSSGSAAMQRMGRQIAPPASSYITSTTNTTNSQPILRGSMGVLAEQPFGGIGGGGGSVPSPAPNSGLNLAATSNNNNNSGQPAKLTLLGNGTSIVHSTPIGHQANRKLIGDVNSPPFLANRSGDYANSDEDEDDLSSSSSNDSRELP